ncbi:nucleoporin Pom152 [Histoplasma ohiense]|nr:nucleoporin Pom152 [Histoplasma ohiense (nom. inval.)]
MNGTPRLRSSFPQTPRKSPHYRTLNDGQDGTPLEARLRTLRNEKPVPVRLERRDSNAPLIPFSVVDAPSQRLYVVAFYLALNAWRMYEFWTSTDDFDSTWLFLKWVSIDGIFLFGLPALRVPWLEWSFATTLAVFMVHAVANAFLMFRIPIPIESWMAALVKVAYDRELSISERRVKPADILRNSSLILGKQIIHILPEGSAVLNPEQASFCIDSQTTQAMLPIRVNQTTPIIIDLLRFDLESGESETISVPPKQLKHMVKQANKGHPSSDKYSPRDLLFPVKKTGIYQLQRVVDDSKLEVRRRPLDTLVAACPKAVIRTSADNRCKGELSDLMLVVEGTPPLKIKYSRKVNNIDHGVSFQSIQPENFRSPLTSQTRVGPLIDPNDLDVSWAQPQRIEVPLNESLSTGGEWIYSIEEVHDACGNVANYSLALQDGDQQLSKVSSQTQQFLVHERPRVSLSGCNAQSYLQVAKGHSIDLPLHFHSVGRDQAADAPYTLTYSYKSEATQDDSSIPPSVQQISLQSVDDKPRIQEQGWYSLTAISSQFCSGEIFEPASCFLHNPPEPSINLRYEKLYDKCANISVGLLVDLDLIGTPPFQIRYNIEQATGVQTRLISIDSLRRQIDFRPKEAGHYKYEFIDISDRVYLPQPLKGKVPVLEQDVKPPASAQFLGSVTSRKACFGEPVSIDVLFVGEAPWELQYELVHNGKRNKHTLRSEHEIATVVTEDLVDGGGYTLGLTSVKDKSNCKKLLKEEINIDVRPKRPQAAFGLIDKERSILALEDKKVELPLRLEGVPPWTVRFRNLDNISIPPIERTLWNENSIVQLTQRGRYEIVAVSDSTCPGSVDKGASTFEISWISRPAITAIDGSPIEDKDVLAKREVCEGDEDLMEMKFDGTPPYTIRYEQQRRPITGAISTSIKTMTAVLGSASLQMDTSKPGDYSYKIIELGDNLYSFDRKKHAPVTITQRVNPRPSARFEQPNHIYGFCKEEGNAEEVIPIILEGVPPFSLEIGIKHSSVSKPEVLSIPHIDSNRHNLPIPRRYLNLGQHVISIQKVRDARGCQRTTEYEGSSVRVAISDVPTIIPLETQVDYCVGERLSFSLSGHAPFEVYYTFNGVDRKATVPNSSFRRIAEKPGEFVITAVSDGASGKCKAYKNITKIIHEMPSVRVSRGSVSVVEIHEGGEAEMIFEFWGTPPFEFTYTRSSIDRKGKKSQILDTKHDISYEHTKIIRTSDEGSYEVVAIKDKFCSFSTQDATGAGERNRG